MNKKPGRKMVSFPDQVPMHINGMRHHIRPGKGGSPNLVLEGFYVPPGSGLDAIENGLLKPHTVMVLDSELVVALTKGLIKSGMVDAVVEMEGKKTGETSTPVPVESPDNVEEADDDADGD